MQRRGESGQSVKGRRALGPKARKAPAAPALADQSPEQLDRLKRERDEALEQLAATSEVLKIISSSPGELQPVFEAMLANATHICEAKFGTLYLREIDGLRTVATHNAPTAYVEDRKRDLVRPPPDSALGQVLKTHQVAQVADITAVKSYVEGRAPHLISAVKLGGYRTVAAVPMLKDDSLIGVITINRQEVRPFTEKQIELVKNFAAQAVIAIENTRLLNDLRQRTDDLTESLEQQMATSEVLQVISSSTGELQPVFQAMLENATKLCEAKFGVLFRYQKGAFRQAAMLNVPRAHSDSLLQREWFQPEPGIPLDRMLRTKELIHTIDEAASPNPAPSARLAGARSHIAVPMLKDDELVGAIVIYRQEVRPFTEKQIELVKNFAAQAVIAIENTRLLSELRESLQQQTATSEVLSAISSSPGKLQPVFEVLLENATRICEARFGNLLLYENKAFQMAAMYGAPQAFAEKRGREPVIHPGPKNPLFRVAETKRLLHIVDLRTDEAYVGGDMPTRSFVELAGTRTIVIVPMLKDNELIGAIGIYRQEVRPFTGKQIELLNNFAAQAVIAIENTRLLNELRQRTDDLTESLEQQTATTGVLKTISSSPGELEPVFDAILENAVRICGAKFGSLVLFEGNAYRRVALHNGPPAYVEARARDPVRPLAASPTLSRVAATKQVVQVADMAVEQPEEGIVRLGGARTVLAVPMLNDDRVVGVISIYRQEVRPFTDKQTELVNNFADQAVIAIENARLLNELRQRTDDLSESLEQQTATSQVLQVISSSPGELEAVFNSILDNAVRICGARFGNLALFDGTNMRVTAMHNAPPEFEKVRRENPIIPSEGSTLGTLVRTRRKLHIIDLAAEESYATSPLITAAHARSMLAVPMLKENELIGAINIYRQEVRPFSDKQIALLENFAAQAVIAIENARLLNELRQRTDDLSESLEQQTATSEVLKVISSSPGELQPVFDTMLKNAIHICEARFGILSLFDGSNMRHGASYNVPAAFEELRRREPVVPLDRSVAGRVVEAMGVVRFDDIATEERHVGSALVKVAGARSVVGVPMLKEDELVGAIVIYRTEVRPFSDKQVELLTNFAAQAVIAIENTRLLNELRESLQQQTATSEVLKVISSSPGDLEPVFQAMLENATRICEAKFGTLFGFDGKAFRRAAGIGAPPALDEFQKQLGPFLPESGSLLGRALQTKQVAHSPDYAAEAVTAPPVTLGGARSTVAVPMLKDDELVGAIVIYRQEVRPFTEKQIELVQNFAAQAVIAIENTRLLNELRESLQQQTATADVLKVISSSPGELEPVFQAMLSSAVRICEAKFGVLFRYHGSDFYAAAWIGVPPAYEESLRQRESFRPDADAPLGRLLQTKELVHSADELAEPNSPSPAAKFGGARSLIAVPMFKGSDLVGAIVIYRQEVRPFTDKQIELVTNFAAQAVIAIENTRLLSELRESLQQQTATSDVLKVISRSTFDLQTVLNTLTESAARLCEADMAAIIRQKGAANYWATSYGFPPGLSEYLKSIPIEAGRGAVVGQVLMEGKTIHVSDVLADPEYTFMEVQRRASYRTMLGVPLLREGMPIGIVLLMRRTVQPFTDRQIELVTTFADQAAIAIENVRLFESVEARTRELAKSLDELRTAQDRLVQTEKLASLGQLTAGIAHEIKNPLNFVNNFSAISVELIDELRQALAGANLDNKLRGEISEIADMLQGNLDKVVQHGKRANSIVKNMLLHSRQGSEEHRPIDINNLSRRASISPIMGHEPRSRASISLWNDHSTRPPARSMSFRRKSRGFCSI